jgi:lysophospholipase L1-like esterase
MALVSLGAVKLIACSASDAPPLASSVQGAASDGSASPVDSSSDSDPGDASLEASLDARDGADGGATDGGTAEAGVTDGGIAANQDAGAGAASALAGFTKLTGKVKIMPLGDSITATTCWRARLWERLVQGGRTNFDFVGTQVSTIDCNDTTYDPDNEGHSGYLVGNLEPGGQSAGELDQWLSANTPDVVLMHFGTNDVWWNLTTSSILDAYTFVLGELRQHNPKVVLLIAKIIPMAPTNPDGGPNCPTCEPGVEALDAAIDGWAAAHTTATSPILVVDQWTGFDAVADTRDGVHPNDSGSVKMAARWYGALVQLF